MGLKQNLYFKNITSGRKTQMDINEKVIMSLESYNRLILDNVTLKHELETAKKRLEGVFELDPIYNNDSRASVALGITGQALYEEFASAHPEYEFASAKNVSFYSVATKGDSDA
jgi:hypothetical protein